MTTLRIQSFEPTVENWIMVQDDCFVDWEFIHLSNAVTFALEHSNRVLTRIIDSHGKIVWNCPLSREDYTEIMTELGI